MLEPDQTYAWSCPSCGEEMLIETVDLQAQSQVAMNVTATCQNKDCDLTLLGRLCYSLPKVVKQALRSRR